MGEGEPRRLVHIVGGVEVADYLDVIAAPDDLAAVWSAALDYLLAHRTEWDCIDLHSLAQWTPSREILRKLAPEKGFEIQVLPEDVAPVLELPDNWDAYLAHLRKKDRHELRRKVRKLEGRDDVTWYLVPTGDRERALEAMRTFIKLHRKSGPDKAHFMNEQMAAFFMDMAAELAPTGLLELSLLDIGDHAASAYLSFSYNKRLYLYNSGYDPRFASYSAGMALLAYRIHKAIVQGLRYFDFLRGDEPYKYDFGGKDTFVYRALLTPAAEA